MSNSTRVHRPSVRLNKTVLVAAALTLGAIGSGCGSTSPASPVDDATPTGVVEATSTAEYGEAVAYSSGIGGQITTDNDLVRIGVVSATDNPKEKATLAVYFRDQSQFDTTQTFDIGVPVDIGGFSIELTTVNMAGEYVVVDIRDPLETTN